MTDITNEIKSRGYWRVVIRPANFRENRIENIAELFPLVRKCSVQIRGWDFPHIDRQESLHTSTDFVRQEISWRNHVEHWRFYQSGQFVYLGAFTVDWIGDWENVRPTPPRHGPGNLLGVGDVIARFSEFLQFASALASTSAAGNEMIIDVNAVGLENRELWVDSSDRFPFDPERYVAKIPEFRQKRQLSQQVLIADSQSYANEFARELFRRFGWDPSLQLIESHRQIFR